MTVGISGKGGVGKSTVTACLARLLGQRGSRVVAIDCDSDPHLAITLGVDEESADRQEALLRQNGKERHLPSGLTVAQVIEHYGDPCADGVTVLLGSRVEHAGWG